MSDIQFMFMLLLTSCVWVLEIQMDNSGQLWTPCMVASGHFQSCLLSMSGKCQFEFQTIYNSACGEEHFQMQCLLSLVSELILGSIVKKKTGPDKQLVSDAEPFDPFHPISPISVQFFRLTV